jgi:hypothetical protein
MVLKLEFDAEKYCSRCQYRHYCQEDERYFDARGSLECFLSEVFGRCAGTFNRPLLWKWLEVVSK